MSIISSRSSSPLAGYPAVEQAEIAELQIPMPLAADLESDDDFIQVELGSVDLESGRAEEELVIAWNRLQTATWSGWVAQKVGRWTRILSGNRYSGDVQGWQSYAAGLIGSLQQQAQSDETKEALSRLQVAVGHAMTTSATVAKEVVRLARVVFAESGHPAKEVKYAYAFDGVRQVFSMPENGSLIAEFNEVVGSMSPSRLKDCLEEMRDRLQGDYTQLKPYRDSYQKFVVLLDEIAEIIDQNAFAHPAIEAVVSQILQQRWFATNLENHPEALVELFSKEALEIDPKNMRERFISLNHAIHAADNTEVGKPLIALGMQCLEGTIGSKYYTGGCNVPQQVNQERINGRILQRYRGASPTFGLTTQEAMQKMVTLGHKRPTDEVAPNMRLLLRWMASGDRNEHILFAAHQTPLEATIGDESGRIDALLDFARMNPNFHFLVQSVNPSTGDRYIVPPFAKDEQKSWADVSSRLWFALNDKRDEAVFTTGIYLPQEYRNVNWEPQIRWIHETLFDGQTEFTQKEWLAFMMVFYELQKLVIKTDLLERGVNLVATTDPCKDDLDRGGAKWITEMLLLGISTKQVVEPGFLNYVVGMALGRPILVKKIGMVPKWAEASSVIIEKLMNQDKWAAIKEHIDALQKGHRVEELLYPKGEPQLYGREEFDIHPREEVVEVPQDDQLLLEQAGAALDVAALEAAIDE